MTSRSIVSRAASLLLGASIFGLAACALPSRPSSPVTVTSAVPTETATASSVNARRDAGPRRASMPGAYATIPLVFEENRGQAAEGVQFLARGSGYDLAVAGTGLSFSTAEREVRMTMVGAREPPDHGPPGAFVD